MRNGARAVAGPSSPAALPGLPRYPLAHLRSVVVVAALPYDAVAGFGGAMAMLGAAGARLRVVLVAEGPVAGPAQTRALRLLGGPRLEIVRLGVPAGALHLHLGDVTRRLGVLVRGFELCAAPWSGDRRADPGAARWAALLACGLRLGPPLVEYRSAADDGARPGGPPAPWARAAYVAVPRAAALSKRRALECWSGPGAGSAEEAPHEILFR